MRLRLSLLVALVAILGITRPLMAQDADWEKVKAENPTLDTDKDEIPDWWEMKYGLNPRNRFDARLDPDGDKVKNLDEFKNDTDPKSAKDADGDGVPDDWMKAMGLTDASQDHDGDGVSTKEEFEAGTDPKDPASSPKKEAAVSQKRKDPSMVGIRENVDASIPDNHQIRPNVFKYNDPIGDDKGPGYYTYPTNPVYAAGSFDIVSFEVDASGKDNMIFKITVNSDLKQDWGMAADFDVQQFQIYIDMDGVPGSGNVVCIPGLNVFFDPGRAWDRVVVVSPQPNSRVQIEVDVKAKDIAENVVVPLKISGQGRTIIAVVPKKDMGIAADADISKWAWQVVAQSNEGYPDPDDMLTRNVNEYRGLHRFGEGSDYWGDPELMDILVWPAKGTMKEAEDQFAILNIWESYPDPKLDIKAVVPLLSNDETEQWMPKGGYKNFAKELAAKIKPPAQKDKYVSDNFDLYGKLFFRWNWNLDPSKVNEIRNSLELGIDGKAFTDLLDFYIRFELANWENTKWQTWRNSTPGQEDLAIQARRVNLIKPFPTVDLITIGNYELNYNAWVLGQAWYPDRDKVMGLFVDGSVEGVLSYSATVHYPLNWIGFEWGKGENRTYDIMYGYKVIVTAIPNVKINTVLGYYTDYEINPLSTDPKTLLLRARNLATEADADVKLPLGFVLQGLVAFSSVGMNPDFYRLEIDSETDIDGNKKAGLIDPNAEISVTLPEIVNNTTNWFKQGLAGKVTLKNDNLFNTGLGFLAQGFYVDPNFVSLSAARGDTSDLSGSFGGVSGTADVFAMQGNQSCHRAPQGADFVADVPVPVLPTEFLVEDPVTGTKGIGWVNENWEGVAATGWRGGTVVLKFSTAILKSQLEGSYILHGSTISNDSQFYFISEAATNNFLTGSPFTFYTPYNNISRMRGYFFTTLNIFGVLKGLELTPAVIFERIGTLTAMNPVGTSGVEDSITLGYSSIYIGSMFSAGLQWNKTFKTVLTYKNELGIYNADLAFTGSGGFVDKIGKGFMRHRIILTGQYSLPVGYYKVRGEYWYEGEQADFPGRTPYGAYFVLEWEYGF